MVWSCKYIKLSGTLHDEQVGGTDNKVAGFLQWLL